MFSLIFSIISIGLVVALAAGTMYYISVSTEKHAKEAAAAGLLTQGEQIVAAIDMRSITADGPMTHLQQLVARNYLSSLPTPASGTYEPGLVAKDSDWWLLAPGMQPAVMLQNKLDAETCLAVNRKLGLEGIKSKPDAGRRIQCFGDAAPYTLLLNPSAKPDVLGPAIESWNRCVADPTSPGCAATAMPEPFCVANPTDAACTTSTSTPVCVADQTNALCVPPTDPGKSFCELNPTAVACTTTPVGPQPTCVVDPTNALCLVPPDATPFCVATPTHVACTTGGTPICVADPTNALCVAPAEPGKSFCELNPANALCTTTPVGPQPTCVVDPTNALCLVPPTATPFCDLNPAHAACTLLTPTPLCIAEPTHAFCTTTTPPPGGSGSYCKAPLGCTYCWMSNPTTGSCLTTPIGAEPDLPFILPTNAKPLPAPELNGGPDSCVPVVKEANGGYAIKSSCNASWCQNAVDGGSLIIYGTEATGLYGCKPSGASTLPLCTLDIAIETVYARPELHTNPVIAEWFATDPGYLLWSAELGWHAEYLAWDTGLPDGYSYADFAEFKTEVIDYTTAPDTLLSSLPADVCVPVEPNQNLRFDLAASTCYVSALKYSVIENWGPDFSADIPNLERWPRPENLNLAFKSVSTMSAPILKPNYMDETSRAVVTINNELLGFSTYADGAHGGYFNAGYIPARAAASYFSTDVAYSPALEGTIARYIDLDYYQQYYSSWSWWDMAKAYNYTTPSLSVSGYSNQFNQVIGTTEADATTIVIKDSLGVLEDAKIMTYCDISPSGLKRTENDFDGAFVINYGTVRVVSVSGASFE